MKIPARSPSISALAVLLVTSLPTVVIAQSLRGSPASVDRMYHYASSHDLHFYETSKGVRGAVDAGRFVRLSGNDDFQLSGVSFPYVLPATRTFVHRLAAEYHSACGEPMVVTSAVRPEARQPVNSTPESVHPTGIAVDLRKPRGACLSWLRHVLESLEATGVIEATEEHYPPHFHVAVYSVPYKRYVERQSGTEVMVADGDVQQYEIRKGDSLWSIAHRYGVSVEQLQQLNDLSSATIKAGETIRVPSGQ
ncbi:MAG TPA: DUF5715 family protein [Gemmatimonadaceae bacterium]|jgi:hypothetical protein|nr:DUF5715 family protein [Gemmatimonadaceae bacterium]